MTDSLRGAQAAAGRRKATALAAATAIAAIVATLAVTAAANWFPAYATLASIIGLVLVVVLAVGTMQMQYKNALAARELEVWNASLQAAGDEAATANLARARFIADVSHDLRQPLHALGLFLDALERRVTPGDGEKILLRTREASSVLNRAFGALIDLTRVEADTLIPEVEMFAIDDLLVRLEDETASIASSAALDLHVVHSRARVVTDERLLGHMLRTLLSNALEGGLGRFLLGARRRGDRVWIELHCSTPGTQGREWDVLASPAVARASGRSAEELDLLVVRRLADLMGIDLRVVAKPDRGAAISVGLPRASAGVATPLRNRSILLVADDASRRALDAVVLACAGAVVHVACNLRQADHAVRTNRFELLVTDLTADDAAVRGARAKLAAALPSLPNRTPPDKLVSAVEATLNG